MTRDRSIVAGGSMARPKKIGALLGQDEELSVTPRAGAPGRGRRHPTDRPATRPPSPPDHVWARDERLTVLAAGRSLRCRAGDRPASFWARRSVRAFADSPRTEHVVLCICRRSHFVQSRVICTAAIIAGREPVSSDKIVICYTVINVTRA
jgi:hypothetical protein